MPHGSMTYPIGCKVFFWLVMRNLQETAIVGRAVAAAASRAVPTGAGGSAEAAERVGEASHKLFPDP